MAEISAKAKADRKRVDEHYAKGQKERAEGKAKAAAKKPKAKVKSTTGWQGLIDSLSE